MTQGGANYKIFLNYTRSEAFTESKKIFFCPFFPYISPFPPTLSLSLSFQLVSILRVLLSVKSTDIINFVKI